MVLRGHPGLGDGRCPVIWFEEGLDVTVQVERLVEVPLRHVWMDEASVFAPWLAANPDRPFEAIGMELGAGWHEVAVGHSSPTSRWSTRLRSTGDRGELPRGRPTMTTWASSSPTRPG